MPELSKLIREKILAGSWEERQNLRQTLMETLTADSKERILFEVLLRGPKH